MIKEYSSSSGSATPAPDQQQAPGTPDQQTTPGNNGNTGESIFDTGKTATPDPFPGNPGVSIDPGGSGSTPKPDPLAGLSGNTGKNINIGSLVSGATAVDLMDTIIPSLIVALFGYVGYSLEKKGMSLNAKEKEVITPFMQQCLNAISIDLNNPFYNLGFVLAFIYGTKIIEQLPNVKKAAKVVKMEEPKAAAAAIEEKLTKQQEQEKVKQELIKNLKSMTRPVAISWLRTNKKMNMTDATKWYNKNVA